MHGHGTHGRSRLLVARFGPKWNERKVEIMEAFPPHIVLTGRFYPRVPRGTIPTGDLETPFYITFNMTDPTYPVVQGGERVMEVARHVLGHIGCEVDYADKLVVSSPHTLTDNVLRVSGVELICSTDAKSHGFRVE